MRYISIIENALQFLKTESNCSNKGLLIVSKMTILDLDQDQGIFSCVVKLLWARSLCSSSGGVAKPCPRDNRGADVRVNPLRGRKGAIRASSYFPLWIGVHLWSSPETGVGELHLATTKLWQVSVYFKI